MSVLLAEMKKKKQYLHKGHTQIPCDSGWTLQTTETVIALLNFAHQNQSDILIPKPSYTCQSRIQNISFISKQDYFLISKRLK